MPMSPTGIDFKTGTTVTEVDGEAKKLKTQSGDTIGYDKLILATGSGVSLQHSSAPCLNRWTAAETCQ